MEQSKLNLILEQHKLWIETNGVQGTRANLVGADLTGANLRDAYLEDADLRRANLSDANLTGVNLRVANLKDAILRGAVLSGAYLGAYLKDAVGLPNVSWIIPGCLVQLNRIKYGFYLEKERKWDNFVQDSFGFIVQDNPIEKTFDMLLGDRIIRGIPHWVKYSGLKQILADSKDKTND